MGFLIGLELVDVFCLAAQDPAFLSPLKEIGIPRVGHHTWLFYVASGYQTYVLAFAKQTLTKLSPYSSTFEFIFPFEIYDIFIKHDFFLWGFHFPLLFLKSRTCVLSPLKSGDVSRNYQKLRVR